MIRGRAALQHVALQKNRNMQKKVDDLKAPQPKDTKEGSIFSLDFGYHPMIFERDEADKTFPPPDVPFIIRKSAEALVELEKPPLKLNCMLFRAQFQKDIQGQPVDEQAELRSISKAGDRRKAWLGAFGPSPDSLLLDETFADNVLVSGYGRGNIDTNFTPQMVSWLEVYGAEKSSQDVIVCHISEIAEFLRKQGESRAPTPASLERFFEQLTQDKLNECGQNSCSFYTNALATGDVLYVPAGCLVVRHTRTMTFTMGISMLLKVALLTRSNGRKNERKSQR